MNDSKNKTFIGKLKSYVKLVPDIIIKEKESIVIGRNSTCQIQELKCPRRLYEVKLKIDSNDTYLYSTNLVTNFIKLIRNGEHLAGPGFDYQVIIEPTSSNDLKLTDSRNESKAKLSSNNDDSTKDLELSIKWDTFDQGSVHIGLFKGGGQASNKIVSFDFDGTLVRAKSKSKFPQASSDWKLFDTSIPAAIRKWANQEKDSHRFVIFTNQLGISKGVTSLKSIKKRIESALLAIDVPCIVFIAAEDNIFRKPRPGLYDLFQSHYNQNLNIDLENSFYVGDAAGRKTLLNRDHSCCDLLFAFNTGLKFLTPEQFLANQRPKKKEEISTTFHHLPKFNPNILLEDSKPVASELDLNGSTVKQYKSVSDLIERIEILNCSFVIIFVGLPGSGKSNFFSTYLSNLGYTLISRDKSGTIDKCKKKFLNEVSEAKKEFKMIKLVIDNINIDKISRSPWIKLASDTELKKICFFFDIDPNHAKHNNIYRKLLNSKHQQSFVQSIPEWLISKCFKNLVLVDYQEGFDLIFRINFKLHFSNQSQKEQQLYFMYLCEN